MTVHVPLLGADTMLGGGSKRPWGTRGCDGVSEGDGLDDDRPLTKPPTGNTDPSVPSRGRTDASGSGEALVVGDTETESTTTADDSGDAVIMGGVEEM